MRRYGPNGPLFPWYAEPVAKLMIAGSITAVVIAAGLLYYQDWRQRSCDRVAELDAHRLSASLERLCNEMKDSYCTSLWKDVSEDHLRFLVGNYYGWGGTSGKCGVLVRITNGAIHTCAMRGTHPTGNRKDRRIYSIQKLPCRQQNQEYWKEVPTIVVAPCTGKAYGFRDPGTHEYAAYYVESMIDEKTCQFRRPRDIPEFEASSRIEPRGIFNDPR